MTPTVLLHYMSGDSSYVIMGECFYPNIKAGTYYIIEKSRWNVMLIGEQNRITKEKKA